MANSFVTMNAVKERKRGKTEKNDDGRELKHIIPGKMFDSRFINMKMRARYYSVKT